MLKISSEHYAYKQIKKRVGQLLGLPVDHVYDDRLRSAIHAVSHRTEDYFDMLAESNGLDGNEPFEVLVANLY